MRIIIIALYTIYKKISFFTSHMLSLIRNLTNSYVKVYKLYNKLLDKISPKTELTMSNPSGKDGSASVFISHILISHIQNNLLTYYFSLFLFYKSSSPLPILKFKKPTVEVEEVDNVGFDIEI